MVSENVDALWLNGMCIRTVPWLGDNGELQLIHH